MITPWLVYGLAVSLLVSAAGWLAERAAKAQRWPTRWVWGGSLLVSLALPVWAWLAPSSESGPSMVALPATLVLESISLKPSSAPASGMDPQIMALAAWAVASALLLGVIAVLGGRLLLRRRGWVRRTLDGVDVWVSRSTGPAALGLIRGHVVVPEWTLELAPSRRRMLVLHEAEHVRAFDPQLALGALLVCALVPWNLPLWWQLRRLRLAIEVDCDRRVLRRAGDSRGYGSLLLEVCQRKSHLAVALAESRSMLERRIRMIMQTTTGPARIRAAALAALAGLVLAMACETPGPTSPADGGGDALAVEDVRAEFRAAECEPTWFINGSRSSVGVVDALEPAQVESIHVFTAEEVARSQGVEVCAVVSVLTRGASVDEEAASRRLVEQLMSERRPVAGQAAPGTPSRAELETEPTFTPMTVRPRLRNSEHVAEALERYYPPLLRDAGIDGTATVWFFIDDEGAVRKALINRSSGYDALDQAALRVAREMEFTPAYNRDRRTAVWVALDVGFDPQQ